MRTIKSRTLISKLIILFLLLSSVSYSQKETIKVTNIKGSTYLDDRLSLAESKRQALLDAQKNALKKAGVSEYIKSSLEYSTSTLGNNVSELLNTETQTQLEGAILDYSIITDYKIEVNENNLNYITVTINATVIKYDTKPDINFILNLTGYKSLYNNGAKYQFSIKSTQDCYLTLFSFIDDHALLLFPNKYEKQFQIKKDTLYNLPRKADIILTLDNKSNEKGTMIFVFTKTPINYIKHDDSQNTKIEDIWSWINAIPLDQRRLFYNPIYIQL